MFPSGARTKSTLLPGSIPSKSLTGLGIVTCPFAVTVVAMASLRVVPIMHKGITIQPAFQVLVLVGLGGCQLGSTRGENRDLREPEQSTHMYVSAGAEDCDLQPPHP